MYVKNSIYIPIIDNIGIPLLYLIEKYFLNFHSSNWMTYLGSSLVLLVVIYLAIDQRIQNSNNQKEITTDPKNINRILCDN